MKKLQLGINLNVSNAEYHADREYLSSSVLKTILKDPAEYKKYYLDGHEKPAPSNQSALDEGSLAHSMILEPHLVHSDYHFYNGDFKKGPNYEQFVAGIGSNKKPIISRPQKTRVEKLISAYKKHEHAPNLLIDAEVEYTICAIINGVPVKVRFDATQLKKGIISDVKTTGYSGDLESFKQTVENLEYDLSAALYTMVAEEQFGRPFDFYFIVLSKREFDCNVYKTSQKTMEKGRRKVISAIELYKKCKASGIWQADAPAIEQAEGIQEV